MRKFVALLVLCVLFWVTAGIPAAAEDIPDDWLKNYRELFWLDSSCKVHRDYTQNIRRTGFPQDSLARGVVVEIGWYWSDEVLNRAFEQVRALGIRDVLFCDSSGYLSTGERRISGNFSSTFHAELEKCTGLRTLVIDIGRSIRLEPMAAMPNLEYLSLGRTPVLRYEPCKNLKKLKGLEIQVPLRMASITRRFPLSDMPMAGTLQFLRVSCWITRDLPEFIDRKKLTNLKNLSLELMGQLSKAKLDSFYDYEALKELNLNVAFDKEIDFSKFPALQKFSLIRVVNPDVARRILCQLSPGLRELLLDRVALNAEAVKELNLKERLSKLEKLSLKNIVFPEMELETPSLKELTLDSVDCFSASPNVLRRLSRLSFDTTSLSLAAFSHFLSEAKGKSVEILAETPENSLNWVNMVKELKDLSLVFTAHTQRENFQLGFGRIPDDYREKYLGIGWHSFYQSKLLDAISRINGLTSLVITLEAELNERAFDKTLAEINPVSCERILHAADQVIIENYPFVWTAAEHLDDDKTLIYRRMSAESVGSLSKPILKSKFVEPNAGELANLRNTASWAVVSALHSIFKGGENYGKPLWEEGTTVFEVGKDGHARIDVSKLPKYLSFCYLPRKNEVTGKFDRFITVVFPNSYYKGIECSSIRETSVNAEVKPLTEEQHYELKKLVADKNTTALLIFLGYSP